MYLVNSAVSRVADERGIFIFFLRLSFCLYTVAHRYFSFIIPWSSSTIALLTDVGMSGIRYPTSVAISQRQAQ